jgi:hypothetical protein
MTGASYAEKGKARAADTIDRLRMDVASAQSRATTAERQRTAALDRIDELVQRLPEHEFSPDENGHNCALCEKDSIWKCDDAAHSSMPRWEDDKLVKEQGWDTPECCKKCGEPHAGFRQAEAERDCYLAVVEAAKMVMVAWHESDSDPALWDPTEQALDDALNALHAITETKEPRE